MVEASQLLHLPKWQPALYPVNSIVPLSPVAVGSCLDSFMPVLLDTLSMRHTSKTVYLKSNAAFPLP